MDWLVNDPDPRVATRTATALVEDHLRRHVFDPSAVRPVVRGIEQRLGEAFSEAGGDPVHLRLDWTSRQAVLELYAVTDRDAPARDEVPTGTPVAAHQRTTVRGWPRRPLTSAELPVVRRSQHTFDAGPPPVVGVQLDPHAVGPAAVALALTAAIDAHPSVSAPQAAVIAGALIATSSGDGAQVDDARSAAEAFVRLHNALGSDAYVVSAEDDVVELAVRKCPFSSTVDGPAAALCHVSSGLAGQLAAKVRGSSTVVLDEAIIQGDPECHLQVLLDAPGKDDEGQPYFWPPRGSTAERVPHLDLSVALPRESVSVPVVRRISAQALRAFGVHEDDVADVELAITEACANVIDHAAATDTYDVKVELAADRCAITVVDQGRGFDAAEVPEQADPDAEMGRGLSLMRALVDNVAFRNEPQAGAVVHMVKALRYDAEHPLRQV